VSDMKIAIILYTVREPAQEDLAGTLKRVRESGFEYVQWSGMPPIPADEIRKALDDAGLIAIAGHCAVDPWEEDFEKELKFWKTVGAADVAPGGMMDDCKDSLDAWRNGVRRLDILGTKLRNEGVRLSYHNHAWEFEKFEGDDRYKLDILYEETERNHLFCELDLAWVRHGGEDPAKYIRKYAGRCPVLHAKDLTEKVDDRGVPEFKPLGQGILDWPEIFKAASESGVEWLVYEQDTHDCDPLESARESFEFLDKNLS
jgi:sugar phosphate isomerase/epimerase